MTKFPEEGDLLRNTYGVCSSVGRAAVSKAAGRGFESLRTRRFG